MKADVARFSPWLASGASPEVDDLYSYGLERDKPMMLAEWGTNQDPRTSPLERFRALTHRLHFSAMLAVAQR